MCALRAHNANNKQQKLANIAADGDTDAGTYFSSSFCFRFFSSDTIKNLHHRRHPPKSMCKLPTVTVAVAFYQQ